MSDDYSPGARNDRPSEADTGSDNADSSLHYTLQTRPTSDPESSQRDSPSADRPGVSRQPHDRNLAAATARSVSSTDPLKLAVLRCVTEVVVHAFIEGSSMVIRAPYSSVALAMPDKLVAEIMLGLGEFLPELKGRLEIHPEIVLLEGQDLTQSAEPRKGWPRLSIVCMVPLTPDHLKAITDFAVVFLGKLAHNRDADADGLDHDLTPSETEEVESLADKALQRIGNRTLHNRVRFYIGNEKNPIREMHSRLADKPMSEDMEGEPQLFKGFVLGYLTSSRTCHFKRESGGQVLRLKYDSEEVFKQLREMALSPPPLCTASIRDVVRHGKRYTELLAIVKGEPD